MDLKTSFAILGLDPEADEAQVKRAYKAQVRRWHPDQFSGGSAIQAGAEEQLKQINIAYARIKHHLPKQRTDPAVPPDDSPAHSRQGGAPVQATADGKSKKHSWVDHLFDALNTFAGNRNVEPPPSPAAQNDANRRKTFEQVLDEMAGGTISPTRKRQAGNPGAFRRDTSGYGRCRGNGATVDAVGTTESPGPVKPVTRVRGIGRSR
jgi:DnaJ-class molecular chaperone